MPEEKPHIYSYLCNVQRYTPTQNRWTMIVDRTHAAYIYLHRVRTKGWSRNKLNKQKYKILLVYVQNIHDSTRIRSNYTRFYSHTLKLYNILLTYVQTMQDSTRIRSNYTIFFSHTFKLYNILLAYVQTIHDSTRIRSNYTIFFSHTLKLYMILLAYAQTIQYSTRIYLTKCLYTISCVTK